MARRRTKVAPPLRRVSTPSDVTARGAVATTKTFGPNAPILAGVPCCTDAGHAVGVVREVLKWDSQQLSLCITPDPGTMPGSSDITIQVPLAGRPGIGPT